VGGRLAVGEVADGERTGRVGRGQAAGVGGGTGKGSRGAQRHHTGADEGGEAHGGVAGSWWCGSPTAPTITAAIFARRHAHPPSRKLSKQRIRLPNAVGVGVRRPTAVSSVRRWPNEQQGTP